MKKGHVNSIDAYAYRSPLRKWNPELKVTAALAVLLLCIAADQMAVSLYIAVTMAVINCRGSRIPWRAYVRLMGIPLVFIVTGCAAIALDVGYWEGGWYLRITRDTLLQSAGVMLRAFGAVSAMYGLTLSTPVSEVIIALRKFHLPKIIVELMNMIYRYIFILLDAERRYRYAAEARLGYVDFKTACRTFGSSMGNLLIVSMKKAGMYYDAMVSRCYDGDLLFLEEEKPVRPGILMAVVLYMVSIIIILAAVRLKGGWIL